MKNNGKSLLIAIVIAITLLCAVLVSCEKKAADTTLSDTTTAPETSGKTDTTTVALTSDNKVTTAAITTEAPIVTTAKPIVTYVSPDLSLVDFDTEIDKSVKQYNNPIRASHGDPFVMRYDGKYYLYYSVGSNAPIYVHESSDLVNWTSKMICTPTDQIPAGVNEHGGVATVCLGAYAPEVVYCNGTFVLVTSPGGMGHYTFTSDSPLGPFKRASENFGCKIDGDIFIDNDGKWYFYYADGKGIQCRPMTSPTTVDTSGTALQTGSIIQEGAGSWTEGSMIVYHDGVYYMTYTGNHVGHTAYRVEYGISHDGPIYFKNDPESQVLVSTTSAAAGIGHSSSVKGPDLDSYYIAYHTRGLDGKARDFNIDRIVFNGDEMMVLGPTVARAACPSMSDIYAQLDTIADAELFTGTFTIEGGNLCLGANAKVMAKESLARAEYTIEITTKNIEKGASAGVIFGYKDDNNFGSALFDTKTEELVITFTVDGKATEYREKLIRSFDMPYNFGAVQSIQVEKSGEVFTFYVNDRILAKHESTLDGLAIGVMTKDGSADFGFVGATAATGGNSNKEFYKPVATQTGYILAAHCREWDIKTGVLEDSGKKYLKAETGRTYNYSVFAEKPANYALATCYRSEKGAQISVFANGEYITDIVLSAGGQIATEIIRGIALEAKGQVISLYIREGEADIFYLRSQVSTVGSLSEDFEDEQGVKASYSDGTKWTLSKGGLKTSGFCKRLWGAYTLGDYTVSVDINPIMASYKAGLLVRTTNPGEATLIAGTSNIAVNTTVEGATKGANWMTGYYVQITNDGVTVYKIDYDGTMANRIVHEIKHEMPSGTKNLTVRCEGATLTIYLDGKNLGSYTDPEPFICGMAGVRCNSAVGVTFDNFKITTIQ